MQQFSPSSLILRDPVQGSLTLCAEDVAIRGACLVLIDRNVPRDQLPPPLPQECGEAARFPDDRRAEGYVLRRQITRMIVAEAIGVEAAHLRILTNEAGALRIEGVKTPLHLSFSARGDFGLIGIARQPVGVDLEVPIQPEAIPFNLLRPDEREALTRLLPYERASAFLNLWTLKEAIAKALGRGFAIAPEAIRLPPSTLACGDDFALGDDQNGWQTHAARLLTWQINRALCLSRSNNQNGTKERLMIASALLPA